MEYVIYQIDRPLLMVKYINTDGSITLTNSVDDAMQFNSDDEARTVADTLSPSADFWGTRPTRPHGHG